MRCPVPVRHARRILCVSPAYSPSFGTFSHAYPLLRGVQAFMPPQGLLVIAAYLPEQWPVRFIDENMGSAQPSDFAWADVIFVSGMHINKRRSKISRSGTSRRQSHSSWRAVRLRNAPHLP
jgi:hypothetical protein